MAIWMIMMMIIIGFFFITFVVAISYEVIAELRHRRSKTKSFPRTVK